jgi:hypothetical protein
VAAAAEYTAASDQFTAAEQRPSTMKAAAARLRAAAQGYDKQVTLSTVTSTAAVHSSLVLHDQSYLVALVL